MPDLIEHERSGKPSRLPLLAKIHPQQVLTFFEWIQINNISPSTGRRIIARGEVEVMQLTPKRIGITIASNAKFQRSRVRKRDGKMKAE